MAVTFYANSIHKVGFDAANEPTNAGETFTASGGETSGVLYDLVDNRRTNVTTWATSGESVLTTIRIDTSTSITCTSMIIDNHNLNTAEVDCDIEQGGTNITLTASYSGTLGSALTADGTAGTPDSDGITLIEFGSAADTQWELEFNMDNDPFNDNITIGEVLLSSEFAPAFNPELQSIHDYDFPGSSFRESDGGQRYGFSTHTNKRRAWRMSWKYMSDSDKSNLEDIFLFTRGSKYPFYIDLQAPLGNSTPTLFYVRFMRPLSFRGLTKDAWAVTVDIEEEV